MDDEKNFLGKLGGSKLGEFKQSVAERAAAIQKFGEELSRLLPGAPGTSKQNKRPLHMKKKDNRRKNKAARKARRHNRRAK